jgi:hypothetical protein
MDDVKRAAALSALAFLASASATAATTILPGFWESSSHTDLLVVKDSSDRKCITADQVDAFLAGQITRHYTCTYDRNEVAAGSVHLEGACVDRHGQKVDVRISGDYLPESFHLEARLRTALGNLPISGSATIDARRLSAECPEAAPPPAPQPPPSSSKP